MSLFAVGLSYKTAPISVRERFAVAESALADRARALHLQNGLEEAVVLSTCNRVEIYGTTRSRTSDPRSLFDRVAGEPCDIKPHLYLHEGVDAMRHLFRVTAGLDSMVPGETEITGQTKNAYEIARLAGVTGPVLNRLFQKAFQVTKEIRTQTAIGRGAVSVKSAAVELLERSLGGDLASRSIMVIGAGQMAERCIRLLARKGARSLLIANRSFDRAIDLTTKYGGRPVCFGDCLFLIRDVDAVITATSSTETILGRFDLQQVPQSRRDRPLFLIDLSVPRNIEPAAGELENVRLYDIDDLEAVTREGIRNREGELAVCHRVIERHLAALLPRICTTRESFAVRPMVSWRTNPGSIHSGRELQLRA